MVDQKIEQESSDSMHSVENALASLWDKAREASLLISTLREEKRRLSQKVEELEEDLQQTKNDFIIQQSQVEKLKQDLITDSVRKNGAISLAEDEKRILQQKLRNVISKIDQYLTP